MNRYEIIQALCICILLIIAYYVGTLQESPGDRYLTQKVQEYRSQIDTEAIKCDMRVWEIENQLNQKNGLVARVEVLG